MVIDCVKYFAYIPDNELVCNFSEFEAIFGYSEENHDVLEFSFGSVIVMANFNTKITIEFVIYLSGILEA